MSSKYDSIQTAAELISEVQLHRLRTFTVRVTSITTLTVEAESDDEAIEKACEVAWEYDADEKHGEILKEDK